MTLEGVQDVGCMILSKYIINQRTTVGTLVFLASWKLFRDERKKTACTAVLNVPGRCGAAQLSRGKALFAASLHSLNFITDLKCL